MSTAKDISEMPNAEFLENWAKSQINPHHVWPREYLVHYTPQAVAFRVLTLIESYRGLQ
jgi:hypothetical protein